MPASSSRRRARLRRPPVPRAPRGSRPSRRSEFARQEEQLELRLQLVLRARSAAAPPSPSRGRRHPCLLPARRFSSSWRATARTRGTRRPAARAASAPSTLPQPVRAAEHLGVDRLAVSRSNLWEITAQLLSNIGVELRSRSALRAARKPCRGASGRGLYQPIRRTGEPLRRAATHPPTAGFFTPCRWNKLRSAVLYFADRSSDVGGIS